MKSIRTIIFVVGILTALALSVTFGQGATAFRKHINAPLGQTTLYAGITSGQTQFAVATGGGNLLPAAPFSISVDNEIMLVNVKNGDLLTVSRAYDSSTASAHNVGATVDCNVIAKDFADIETAVNGIEAGTTTLASATITGAVQAGSFGSDGSVAAGTTVSAVNNITSSTGNVTATAGDVTAGDDVIAGDDMSCDVLTANNIIINEGEGGITLQGTLVTTSIAPPEGQDTIGLGTSDDSINIIGELNVGASAIAVEGQTPGAIRANSIVSLTDITSGSINSTSFQAATLIVTNDALMPKILLPPDDYTLEITAPTTYEGEGGMTPVYHDADISATGEIAAGNGFDLSGNEGEPVTIALNTEGETIGDVDIRNPRGAVQIFTDDGFSIQPINEGEANVGVNGNAYVVSDTTTGTLHTGNAPDEGEPPNTTRWDANGFQIMSGDAQPWDDLRMEPVARTTGTNAPAFEKYFDNLAGTSRGVYLYSFDDAAGGSEKEIFYSVQLPHDWNQGAVAVHVHWVGNNADTTATPRWGIEYTWVEVDGTYGDTTTVYAVGNTGSDANVVAGKHYVTDFGEFTPTASQDGLSSICVARLFRDSANVADTYDVAGNKCGLLFVDTHYQRNSIGSSTEWSGKGEGE